MIPRLYVKMKTWWKIFIPASGIQIVLAFVALPPRFYFSIPWMVAWSVYMVGMNLLIRPKNSIEFERKQD